jgi:hypothetical protein
MTQPIHIFVCGIGNLGIESWACQAERWCEVRGIPADRFVYRSPIFTRFVWQWRRIQLLERVLADYKGMPLKLIGHSNGCALICAAIKRVKIDSSLIPAELHLISPACDSSFEKNGLNAALSDGRVSQVTVHWGGKDEAMWFAAASRTLVGWAGLGYGTLGRSGPKDVATGLQARVTGHFEPTFGHSTWFEAVHFEETMRMVTG